MKQENPMAKYQLQSFGSKRRNTEGMFENKGGNAARDERRAGQREQMPMTFSDMSTNGIARPAPNAAMAMFTGRQQPNLEADNDPAGAPPPQIPSPSAPAPQAPAPAPAPTPGADAPAAGGGSVYDRLKAAGLANLRANFTGQRQSLNEDLARRGLWASTYGSGRLGDLEGQQARAEASLEADLLSGERDDERETIALLMKMAQMFGMGG